MPAMNDFSDRITKEPLTPRNGTATEGNPSPLPELPVEYGREYAGNNIEASATDLAYWKQQLSDIPLLQLPSDHPRPAVQAFRRATGETISPVFQLSRQAAKNPQPGGGSEPICYAACGLSDSPM